MVRIWLAIAAVLALNGCASDEDARFRVGESAAAFAIIGVAESASEREPAYTMLWRRLGPDGAFLPYGGRAIFEARTNASDSLRVEDLPGEFAMARIEPGVYGLDSVFAVLQENGVNYIAQGVVQGPERPSFEVRPGEAIYLGIWEMNVTGVAANTRLWRLNEDDMRMVVRDADPIIGRAQIRETQTRSAPCSPRQLGNMSQRQVC
jgi:hypothetical protein